nr:MAG TPA: hypothetical protein [Caudoviricetes sp.]
MEVAGMQGARSERQGLKARISSHDNCMVTLGKKGGSTPPSSTIRIKL